MASFFATLVPLGSLWCLWGLISPSIAIDQAQTIVSLDAYSQLRGCAQQCIVYGNDGCVGDSIADHIGCPYGCFAYALDSCYCRADVQTEAESWLSTCIKSGCTLGGESSIDISSAVSLYDGYCLSQGYTALRAPQSTSATTTMSQAPAIATPSQTPNVVVYQTVTAASSPTSTSSSHKTTSESLLSKVFATLIGWMMLL